MKLYDFGPAVKAKRVRMFSREKGIEIPIVEVQVREGALFEEPYRSMNPFAVVPFLELDDGTVIGGSVAICKYLEELHPEPSLLGQDARAGVDRDRVDFSGIAIKDVRPTDFATRSFFPEFGSHVAFRFDDRPEMVTVTLGTLDQPEKAPAIRHNFAFEKIPWVHPDEQPPMEDRWWTPPPGKS